MTIEEQISEIRQAFADYRQSEGCGCCENSSKHEEAEHKLAKMLKADEYEDGQGYDWAKYRSEN